MSEEKIGQHYLAALHQAFPGVVLDEAWQTKDQLTITVKVRFTNALDEKMSFNRTFQAYEDYDSTKLLTEVEGELIPQIVDKIVTDIFQAAASNW